MCHSDTGFVINHQLLLEYNFRFHDRLLSHQIATHQFTVHNTPIHNILSTAPKLSISQKALGTLPVDGNVMPKHLGATINN
jgi:hypothetical protein